MQLLHIVTSVFPQLGSDCHPEKGSYGFHWFGNAEELLPVMNRPRKSKSKKRVCDSLGRSSGYVDKNELMLIKQLIHSDKISTKSWFQLTVFLSRRCTLKLET